MDVHRMFDQILEVVGPRDQWPQDILHYLWRQTPRGNDFLNYKERFRLAVFLYINDVPLPLLRRWCQQLHLLRDQEAINHIPSLYRTFHNQVIVEFMHMKCFSTKPISFERAINIKLKNIKI